jgi:hypothetical protein
MIRCVRLLADEPCTRKTCGSSVIKRIKKHVGAQVLSGDCHLGEYAGLCSAKRTHHKPTLLIPCNYTAHAYVN